jgi:hypothetical protein
MDTAALALLVAALTFGLTMIDKIWSGSWSLSGKIASMEQRLSAMILESRREIEDAQESHVQQVGTTLISFRDKFREMEIYVRDNYVKHPDFVTALQQHGELQKAYQAAIIDRLDRVEKKLDAAKPH